MQISEYDNTSELKLFLSYAALDSGDVQDKNQECVQMMTLHTAKGLEFRVVFLVGLEAGLLPHHMSLEKKEDLEEERPSMLCGYN